MSNTESEIIENQLKPSRVIIPSIIGILVVAWLIHSQLDIKELNRIPLTYHTVFWILAACLVYVFRHIFYAWRMRIMSDGFFSWRKCIQLIVIWEFSSAVSPTSVGGAGVALYLLAKEKLSNAKTITIVLYSMVLDTFLFVVTLPLFYFILGPVLIRPNMSSWADLDSYGITFLTVLFVMIGYGSVFYYGLFINPKLISKLLTFMSSLRLFKKGRTALLETADEILISAEDLKDKSFGFHIKSTLATLGAWMMRFIAINCIILAIVPNFVATFYNQLLIVARAETMYVITAFSPTPGAAGVAEYFFGGFYADYIPIGIAIVIAIVWRLITYYSYLIAGALVIPFWIKSIHNDR